MGNSPGFYPTGPRLVAPGEVGDHNHLAMWLDVNREHMQSGTAAKMIFDAATNVSYMSEFCQLEAGDLICTGTLPGVGLGFKPPRYLSVGDKVALGNRKSGSTGSISQLHRQPSVQIRRWANGL